MRADRSRSRQKAVVLVVSIALMSVLAILAVTFAMMTRIERNVSANMVDMVRARMLAQAGMEAAVTRLGTSSGNKSWDGSNETWACGDAPSVPIDQLTSPSYKSATPAYGRTVSGVLQGTYEQLGDTYTLRIADAASQLYINGREPNIVTMLANLGQGIAMETGQRNPCTLSDAQAIIQTRERLSPPFFPDKDQIETIIGSAKWKILKDYVTDTAWVDLSVIEPHPQTQIGGWTNGPIPENLTYQQAVQATNYNPASSIPNTPPPWPAYQQNFGSGRAPVNVNTASAPVLIAVLAGLQGMYLTANTSAQFERTQTAAIGIRRARRLADQIVAYRTSTPFTSMSQFLSYISSIDPPGGVGSPNVEAELIKANANPNTDFNKFNPNRIVTNWVGKEELTYFTTEFCLASMGYYQIESLGRVTSQGGQERATRHLRAFVKIYDVLRHTTQADFAAACVPASSAGATRTFPENLNNYNNPSLLDGQVCIKELPPVAGGAFSAQYDNTLLGTDGFMRYNFFGFADTKMSTSVFNATNTAASDLFPDGDYMSQFRSKLTHYSSYHNIAPRNGTISWWMKPNRLTYTGALQGVSTAIIPVDTQSGYCYFVGNQPGFGFIVNGGHYSQNPYWGPVPGTRYRTDLPWGGDDYFMLGGANTGNALMWGDWHHIAICWDNYIHLTTYFDGQRVIDYTGFYIPRPGYCYLNGGPATDEMQIGTFCWPSWWKTPWQPPNIPFWNDYAESTTDDIRTDVSTDYSGGSFTPPDRYPRSNGGVTFAARFTIPPGNTANVKVKAISYTSYSPTTDNIGNPMSAPLPHIEMQYLDPGSGAWSANFLDVGSSISAIVSRGQTLQYKALWYDGGHTPNDCEPYLDDVTLFYSGGLQFLKYADDPNN